MVISEEVNKRYYLPSEVAVHNCPDDAWISFLGKVYNITRLLRKMKGKREAKPLLAMAGKDVSHWFDPLTQDIRHFVHPVTGVLVPYCPHGPLPHVGPQVPTKHWVPVPDPPWWKDDEKYMVGRLTSKARPVRLVSTMTSDERTIAVCKEDTLGRVLERFLPFNNHVDSYEWKFEERVLDMNKTLEENGIVDERELYTDRLLPESMYIPALVLYYKDDLTVA